MIAEIGTETQIFLFWEYLFQNFGILSLQCTNSASGGGVAIVAGGGMAAVAMVVWMWCVVAV
jgi:hypothetical protein